jgi:cytochrome c-type biogenesis protein
VVSAFLLGAGSTQQLAGSLAYFVAFGLGFGWPLVVLPLLAVPFQRHLIHWTVRYDRALTAAAGLLLVAIGILGLVVEVRPNLL